MEDFEKRGRGGGLGSLPFTGNPLSGLITPEGGRPGALSPSRCRGQSRTGLLFPQCPLLPLEDHPLMMFYWRDQENPQPWPQQPQENHHPPRYTLYDIGAPFMMICILQGRLFSVSGVDTWIPSQNITLPLLTFLEAPLIQSQKTLIWFLPLLDLTMSQTGIYRIPPCPNTFLMF